MRREMGARVSRMLLIAVHAGAWLPLAILAWAFWQDRLGPDPTGAVIRYTGRYALLLLVLSLVPTVVRTVTGFGRVMRVRRPLGLYAFLYAALHALAFTGLDYGFDFGLILTAVLESRREIVGLAALTILAVLALTSIRRLMWSLGRYWKPLHRLTYLAGGLVVLHYVWNYKELRIGPLLAGGVLLLLLIARVPPIASSLGRWRRRRNRGTTT